MKDGLVWLLSHLMPDKHDIALSCIFYRNRMV